MQRRASWIHAGSLASTQALQFGVALILARLLTPHELGLFAIASALTGLLHGARDLGVSAYLQRAPSLDAGQVRAALGLSCAASALMAGGLLALAPGLAAILGDPGLAGPLRTLALGLAVVPVGAVMTALALRDGDADQLARTTAWGNASQAIVAIALAVAGAGAQAPAWGQTINLAVCSLVVWPLRPRALWGPPRLSGWAPILRIGRGTVAGSALTAAQGAAPSLLLGHWAGAAQVGWLGRAQSLTALVPGLAGMALNFGALGRWARLHHRGHALAPAVAASAGQLAAIAWPLLAIAAVLAEPLVTTLFGPAWRQAAAAVGPLAWLAAVTVVFNGLAPALAAVGRPGWAALPQGVTLAAWAVFAMVLAATFDGRLGGPDGLPREGLSDAATVRWFAVCWLIAGLAALPCQWWLCRRWLGLRLAVLLRALLPGAIAAGLAGAAARLGAGAVPAGAPEWLAAAAGLAAALPAWGLALRAAGTASRLRSARGARPARPAQSAAASGRLRITIRK
jgi:O-antigen/teichoic acid export membrane protein